MNAYLLVSRGLATGRERQSICALVDGQASVEGLAFQEVTGELDTASGCWIPDQPGGVGGGGQLPRPREQTWPARSQEAGVHYRHAKSRAHIHHSGVRGCGLTHSWSWPPGVSWCPRLTAAASRGPHASRGAHASRGPHAAFGHYEGGAERCAPSPERQPPPRSSCSVELDGIDLDGALRLWGGGAGGGDWGKVGCERAPCAHLAAACWARPTHSCPGQPNIWCVVSVAPAGWAAVAPRHSQSQEPPNLGFGTKYARQNAKSAGAHVERRGDVLRQRREAAVEGAGEVLEGRLAHKVKLRAAGFRMRG